LIICIDEGTNYYSIDKYLNQLKVANKNTLKQEGSTKSKDEQRSSETRPSTSKNEHQRSKDPVSNLRTSLNMFHHL